MNVTVVVAAMCSAIEPQRSYHRSTTCDRKWPRMGALNTANEFGWFSLARIEYHVNGQSWVLKFRNTGCSIVWADQVIL